MRCSKCNQELHPHSERCPNCGTSARYAIPDGDTMTRVRRQISEIQRENEVSGVYMPDASFSPVLKFDRPAGSSQEGEEPPIEQNPADNFPDESFPPVDISDMVDLSGEGDSHGELSQTIRRMIMNKEDDLLAEYYFKDGITDLERYQLARSYENLEQESGGDGAGQGGQAGGGGEEGMSDAAKRLSEFPEETGVDRILTLLWEKFDAAVIAVRRFFRRHVVERCGRLYRKFDARTEGFMNGMLDRVYYGKLGVMKRKRAGSTDERYAVRKTAWGILGILALLTVTVLIAANIMMSSDLNGKWVVSYDSSGDPNIIMEFKPGGRAAISVKSEDGWHVHKQGRYSTERRNGHDMLTIIYDDGDVKRLYYKIDGRSGTFINVDTNVQVVYQLK